MIAPIVMYLVTFIMVQAIKRKLNPLFEEYIELYPNGYNPYDSMGEFYYNEGDLENANFITARLLKNIMLQQLRMAELSELND